MKMTICVLEKQKIVRNNHINKNFLIARAMSVETSNFIKTQTQITTFLELCDGHPQKIYECFIQNSGRFGFQPMDKFDPFAKMNISLSDLITALASPENGRSILDNCRERSGGLSLQFLQDVFVRFFFDVN